MHTDVTAAPVAGAERITAIDALRGFALLGVFIANLFNFAGWFFLTEAQRQGMAGPMQDLVAAVAFVGLGLAVFAAQIVVSALWLRVFNQGSMEALWRRLTHGGRPRA